MLEQAAIVYFQKKRRRVSIEWTMMDGVSDTEEQARKLAVIAGRIGAHVNLIALNPTPLSRERASSEGRIDRFAGVIGSLAINVTIRTPGAVTSTPPAVSSGFCLAID